MTRTVQALRRATKRLSANGPGITVSVIAMVVALTGVAFAGAGALTPKEKKEVKALIKKEVKPIKGETGAPGSPGAQGPAGPKGDTGAPGVGTPGAPGASALVTPVAVGEQECAELGGALVEEEGSGSPVEVCNGEKGATGIQGPPGPPGSPWVPDNTLPAGAQLKGNWMVSGSGSLEAPLGFAIRLGGNVTAANVWLGTGEEPEIEVSPGVFEKTEFMKHCSGTGLNPEVAAGFNRTLCVYRLTSDIVTVNLIKVTRSGGETAAGAGRVGGFLTVELPDPGLAHGTFAVSGG